MKALRGMRLLHRIEVSGEMLRIERAPSGINHYFVGDREVSVSDYLAVAGRGRVEGDKQLRSA